MMASELGSCTEVKAADVAVVHSWDIAVAADLADSRSCRHSAHMDSEVLVVEHTDKDSAVCLAAGWRRDCIHCYRTDCRTGLRADSRTGSGSCFPGTGYLHMDCTAARKIVVAAARTARRMVAD